MAMNDNNAMLMAASQAAGRGGSRQSLTSVGRPYAPGSTMDPHSIGNAAMLAGMQPPLQITNGFGSPAMPGSLQITNGFDPTRSQPDEENNMANGGPVMRKSGPVRGPGTGTSDSVKATVPEGTYIMPADSTEEIGEQNLAAMGFRPGMKPAGRPSAGALGFKPRASLAEEEAEGEGPGLGFSTSSHVPVNLSNGEFRLSPEQVHAIGVQVLEGLKAATHEPAEETAEKYEQDGMGEEGCENASRADLFFADGGLVEDPKKRPLATSPSNTYPGNQAERAGNIYAKSNGDAAGFAKAAFPGTTAAIQGAGQAIQDAYNQGGVGAAIGQGFRGSMVPAVGLVDDAATGVRKLLDPAANALKTFVTGDATPIGQEPASAGTQSATAKPTPAAAAPAPAASVAANAPTGSNYGNEPNAAGSASLASPSPATPTGTATAVPGVRRIDEPGKSPMFTNVEQGAAGQAAAGAQPTAQGLGFRPGGSDVMGILQRESQIRASMGDLRDQINFNGGNGIGFRKTTNDEIVRDMLTNGNTRDRATALGFMAGDRDAAMKAAQVEQDQALRQAEMEGRQGIATEDLAMRQEAQGFKSAAQRQLQTLQEKLMAETNPDKRNEIQRQILLAQGKAPADRFVVVGGGQEVDPSNGMVRTLPARVFDSRTGQYVEQPKVSPAITMDRVRETAKARGMTEKQVLDILAQNGHKVGG